MVAAVNIPVIGNGDITDATQVSHFFTQTQCAGFMIARASVGQPWIFQQIQSLLSGGDFECPTQSTIGKLFLQHARGLIELDGEYNAMMQCRKIGKYYARSINQKNDFLAALYQCNTYESLETMVNHYW